MNTHSISFLGTKIGAGVGLVAFIVLGAIPGVLYGGYAGLTIAAVILGAPVEPTLLTKALTFGGMVLGTLASLSLFLVIGAFLGTLVQAIGIYARSLVRPARQPEAHRPMHKA